MKQHNIEKQDSDYMIEMGIYTLTHETQPRKTARKVYEGDIPQYIIDAAIDAEEEDMEVYN